ncbi:peptidyl-tRNA hydrolase II domain-containing protein [Sporodiniella umbellata]|nr:peptidyl-tRNA hydrolase II domain-containing protein [Sporodiniella umbellata]
MAATKSTLEPLTMFIVIRKDLAQKLNWPIGSIIAQACHASTAMLHLTYDSKNTKDYFFDVDNMHKVILQTKDKASLEKLENVLLQNQVPCKKWVEQPENIPTALATAPLSNRSPEVLGAFRKYCSLYK